MECGTTVGAETGFFAIRAPTDARSDLGLRSVITQNPRIPQASGYISRNRVHEPALGLDPRDMVSPAASSLRRIAWTN